MSAWLHPPRKREPWLARNTVKVLIITAAFLVSGLVMALADKALGQAAYDAANHSSLHQLGAPTTPAVDSCRGFLEN